MRTRRNSLNPELALYIDSSLGDYDNNLQLALTIYILLAKKLVYSPEYACLNNNRNFRSINEVNLNNNSIICTQWAKIYCALLKKYGVDAGISSNNQGHYYVTFTIDNVIYCADSSIYGGNFSNYRLSDFSNVQYGFDLFGFDGYCVDFSDVSHNKHIQKKVYLEDQINIVCDRLYNREKSKERLLKFKKYFSNKFKYCEFDSEFNCVLERMPYINIFSRLNLEGGTVEKHQLLKMFVGILFSNMDESNIFVIPIYDKYDNYKMYSILCFYYKGEYIYYLQDDNGFEFVCKDNLLDEILRRGLIFGKFKHLPGFYLTTSDSFMLKKTL